MQLITPPAVEPIAVEDARDELRLDPADDAALARRIKQARRAIEQWTGHRLITQEVIVLGGSVHAGVLYVPVVPLQSVHSATVSEAGALPREIDVSALSWRADGWIEGFAPSVQSATVRLTVGYGATADTVPEDFVIALTQLVGQYSEWREALAGGLPGQSGAPPSALPHSVTDIIAARRLVRLA